MVSRAGIVTLHGQSVTVWRRATALGLSGSAGAELLLDEDDVEQIGGEADALVQLLDDRAGGDLGPPADEQESFSGHLPVAEAATS